jgi:hypothetical protein
MARHPIQEKWHQEHLEEYIELSELKKEFTLKLANFIHVYYDWNDMHPSTLRLPEKRKELINLFAQYLLDSDGFFSSLLDKQRNP